MERDERQSADVLDQYWDAVLSGSPLPSLDERDADLAKLIAGLEAARDTPPLFPDPLQAWDNFARHRSRDGSSDGELFTRLAGGSVIPETPNGVIGRRFTTRHRSPLLTLFGSAAAGYLATAALLLLTVTVGFLVFRQNRAPDNELIAVPALVATPDAASSTPGAGAIESRTLFETTFAADELPEGELGVVFYRLILDPGATLPQLSGLSCGCAHFAMAPGVGVELIRDGEYTVRLDAPMRVQRGGLTKESEDVPPGTEVTLGPGDAAIYTVYDARGTIRNTGSAPAVVVGVAMLSADETVTPPSLPAGARGELLSQSVASDWQTLPTGPVTVTLRQVTLPGKATTGPYEAESLETLSLEQGAITRGILGPGETAPRIRPVVHYAELTNPFAFADVSPGVRRVITNVRDEPAVFLALTIEPAGRAPDLANP